MKQYKSVEVATEQLDAVHCNMCGCPIEKNSHGYLEDFLSIEKKWGYGSAYDGETHQIDLCQECYAKLIQTLKLLPFKDDRKL